MTDKEFVLSIYPNAFLEEEKDPKYRGWWFLWSDIGNERKLLGYFQGSDLIWSQAKVWIDRDILTKLEQ